MRATFPHRLLPYLLVAPQLAISLVFFYWPAIQALNQSVRREDPFTGQAYRIEPAEGGRYRLCAGFELPPDRPQHGRWSGPSGLRDGDCGVFSLPDPSGDLVRDPGSDRGDAELTERELTAQPGHDADAQPDHREAQDRHRGHGVAVADEQRQERGLGMSATSHPR